MKPDSIWLATDTDSGVLERKPTALYDQKPQRLPSGFFYLDDEYQTKWAVVDPDAGSGPDFPLPPPGECRQYISADKLREQRDAWALDRDHRWERANRFRKDNRNDLFIYENATGWAYHEIVRGLTVLLEGDSDETG